MGFTRAGRRTKGRGTERNDESQIFTVRRWRCFCGGPEATTNSAPPVRLGGVDTADFIAEKQQ